MNICKYTPTKYLDNKGINDRLKLLFKDVCYLMGQPGGVLNVFDATITFSVNADPNTPGTVFSPDSPELDSVVYVSDIDSSFWTWNGSNYVTYIEANWKIGGNTGTNPVSAFIGTLDNVDLHFKVNNVEMGVLYTNGNVKFGGINNTVSGGNASIFGGINSVSSSTYSSVFGGVNGTASGSYSTVIGGEAVATTGYRSIGVGGLNNTASAILGLTIGGQGLLSRSYCGTVIGSYNDNTYTPNSSTYSTANRVLDVGIGESSGTRASALIILHNGNSGFGVATPTATIHLKAGTTSLAPLKLTAGTNLTTPEAGAVEFDGTHFYGTVGSTRYQLDQQAGSGALTIGTSTITSGTTTKILYDNAGVLGEYTISGTGSVAMTASAALTGTPTAPTAALNTDSTQLATTAFVQQELTDSTVYFDSTFGGDGSSGDPIKQIASYNVQTGSSYSLQASDNGRVVTINNGSDVTLTVPTGLPVGFNCKIVQLGAGKAVFTPSSTTINNRQSFTKTAGQYGYADIIQYSTDVFLTFGDMI